jgi:hypothetical protein
VPNFTKIEQTVYSLLFGDEGTWPPHKAFVYFVKNASNCKVHGIANGGCCLADGVEEPHKLQTKCNVGLTVACSWWRWRLQYCRLECCQPNLTSTWPYWYLQFQVTCFSCRSIRHTWLTVCGGGRTGSVDPPLCLLFTPAGTQRPPPDTTRSPFSPVHSSSVQFTLLTASSTVPLISHLSAF